MDRKHNKAKRSQRVIYVCQYLVEHPNQVVSLSHFSDFFQIAKSSLSEDITLIKETFKEYQLGYIDTVPGVSGGVVYYPMVSEEERQQLKAMMIDLMKDMRRILPGNYIQINDVLQDSKTLVLAAKIIAERYRHLSVDTVMTIETQGVGLATAVARFLNVNYVVVRRDSKDTTGPTISVNYVSGSHQIVSKMELAKNSLPAHSRVLIIDDFMRNGGTVNGLMSLIREFDCECVGTCVFAENTMKQGMILPEYESLFKVEIIYNQERKAFELRVETGCVLD